MALLLHHLFQSFPEVPWRGLRHGGVPRAERGGGICDSPGYFIGHSLYTLPDGKIAPENGWLEDPFLLGRLIFRCYVSFRECILCLSLGGFSLK